jgi:hypothetical protein
MFQNIAYVIKALGKAHSSILISLTVKMYKVKTLSKVDSLILIGLREKAKRVYKMCTILA